MSGTVVSPQNTINVHVMTQCMLMSIEPVEIIGRGNVTVNVRVGQVNKLPKCLYSNYLQQEHIMSTFITVIILLRGAHKLLQALSSMFTSMLEIVGKIMKL